MRLAKPRVPPLDLSEMDPELRARFGDGPILDIFRTLAHHPKLLKRWLVFGSHVLGKSTLPAREREIAILRIGFLCRSGYEWGRHVAIAREAGVGEDEIAAVAVGPEAGGWSDAERALLRAADELHGDAFVSDATWEDLGRHFSLEQKLDLLFTVGQYQLVSMVLNTLGVQPEGEDFPALPGSDGEEA